MKSLLFSSAAACLVALAFLIFHGEGKVSALDAQAAAPQPPAIARPLIISNEEWTFNLNNVCTAGPFSVYHIVGTKEPMMLTLGGLDATLAKLVESGTWIKTAMPKYINLNNVASVRVTKASPREIEITFTDGFKEQLTGDDATLFLDAAAKLPATK